MLLLKLETNWEKLPLRSDFASLKEFWDIYLSMATWESIWCGCSEIPKNKACWNNCTSSHNKIFEYIRKKFTNIRIYSYPNFSMVRIFEYIRIPFFLYSYSNIKYSARNIRIFKYIRIFEYFWPNIWYSNTNIKKLEYEYIRIFELMKS